MERPLLHPNLPEKQVRVCFANTAGPANETLYSKGVAVISPLPDEDLPAEEQTHADLLVCHVGAARLLLAPSQMPLLPFFRNAGFFPLIAGSPGNTYPDNVRLNVAVGSDFAVGCFRYSDPLLCSTLVMSSKRLIPVKQGYAKCSLCFVTERAVITEDAGIARSLKDHAFDVLTIAKGDVQLSSLHYGFFGGAAGKISPETLAVNGSLKYHQNGKEIIDFLRRHGVTPLELHNGPVTDIGGILPLTEEGDPSDV